MIVKISKALLLVVISVVILFLFVSFAVDNILCRNAGETTRIGMDDIIQKQDISIKKLIAKVLQGEQDLAGVKNDLNLTKKKLDSVSKQLDTLTAK